VKKKGKKGRVVKKPNKKGGKDNKKLKHKKATKDE
jgi:hypothetical protein